LTMIKVFVEYKIKEEMREQYLQEISNLSLAMEKIGATDFLVYEGVDQSNLFVEMFNVPSIEAYRKLKRKRSEEKAGSGVFWQSINDCIDGGSEKLHMWAFIPVTRNEG
jgi:hypothetical protein